MADRLQLPYSTHPEFQFDGNRLAVDSGLVEEFAGGYRALDGAALAPADRTRLEAEVRTILARVFDALAVGAAGADHRAFVTELERECRRVLEADLAHFAGKDRDFALTDKSELEKLETQRFFLGRISAQCVAALARIS